MLRYNGISWNLRCKGLDKIKPLFEKFTFGIKSFHTYYECTNGKEKINYDKKG
jgi:hypothetical protein